MSVAWRGNVIRQVNKPHIPGVREAETGAETAAGWNGVKEGESGCESKQQRTSKGGEEEPVRKREGERGKSEMGIEE